MTPRLKKFIEDIPDYAIECLAIFIVAMIISKSMRWMIKRRLNRMDPESADSTGLKFLKNTLRFLIWMSAGIAMIFAIPQLRSVALTLFAGAGLLVAIIGLAAQAALGNIISGFFIVIFKPFRVGDIITVGADFRGKVTDITLRHTNIRDFRNRRIIIPNSQVSSQTIVNENIADKRICRWVEFRIALDADVDKAIDIIRRQAQTHPHSIDNRTEEELLAGHHKVGVRVTNIGEYFVELTAFVWTPGPSEAWELHTDLNYAVKKEFDLEGIEIPVPYRMVKLKQEQSLSTETPSSEAR